MSTASISRRDVKHDEAATSAPVSSNKQINGSFSAAALPTSAKSAAVESATSRTSAMTIPDVTDGFGMGIDPDFGISSFMPWPQLSWPFHFQWPSLFGGSSADFSGAAAAAAATRAAADGLAAARAAASTQRFMYSPYSPYLQTPTIDMDLIERKDKFMAEVEVAGVRASDVDVKVDRNTRIVRVGVIRRRNLNCDCDFTENCSTHCGISLDGKKSESNKQCSCNVTCKGVSKCDGKCKGKVQTAHCHDCEVKGQVQALPELLPGCCGHCTAVVHEKAAAGGHHYRRSERVFGRAQRAFRAAADVDLNAIDCVLHNGVLTITMPRDVKHVDGGAGAAVSATAHSVTLPIRCVSTAETKAIARNKEQWNKTITAAATVGGDPTQRAAVLHHHITAPNDNPAVAHNRLMSQAAAVGGDPRARAHILRHHMMRADPLAAWAFHSPFAAYSSMLRDAMELARDFDLVSYHVPPPPIAPTAAPVGQSTTSAVTSAGNAASGAPASAV